MTFIIGIFNFIAKLSINKQNEKNPPETCANLTEFFLVNKIVYYLNEFCDLIFGNVYLNYE